MSRLDVKLQNRTYGIIFGNNVIAEASGLLLENCPDKRAAVISDDNVWGLHAQQLTAALSDLGIEISQIVIPHGEKSKSLDMLKHIYSELFRYGIKRSDPVVAFGGGVVGDLAGFAAASYMRGVPFIQIPTTLLAQVDSSVGGKVAVNLEQGKNLVGSFYQPCLVLAGTQVLSTLPAREWNAGMAEVVKYTALGETELLSLLEAPGDAAEKLQHITYLCCKCKAGFVERDERDTAERMMLNFGHSFGHAIEKYHNFEKYNHGEAVAVGMALALRTGVMLGITEPETEQRFLRLMDTCGLRYELTDDIAELIPLMMGDKKNIGGDISLVLLRKFGEPFIYKISEQALRKMWKEAADNG